jgi:hypothetical protein
MEYTISFFLSFSLSLSRLLSKIKINHWQLNVFHWTVETGDWLLFVKLRCYVMRIRASLLVFVWPMLLLTNVLTLTFSLITHNHIILLCINLFDYFCWNEFLKRILSIVAHQWFGNLVTMEWWKELWYSFESYRCFILLSLNMYPKWRDKKTNEFDECYISKRSSSDGYSLWSFTIFLFCLNLNFQLLRFLK